LILGGLAAALVAGWASLTLLARRTAGRSVLLAVALACAGAGLTVMLSGYASGGLLGFPLAAAVAGAALASLVLSGRPDLTAVLSLGVVGLSTLVVIGRFFGELTTAHAALLFCAPLLCWLPQLPGAGRLPAWCRGVVGVGLVSAALVLVVVQAHEKSTEDSPTSPSPGAREPTVEDYSAFGK
jgi:hypothetical protein